MTVNENDLLDDCNRRIERHRYEVKQLGESLNNAIMYYRDTDDINIRISDIEGMYERTQEIKEHLSKIKNLEFFIKMINAYTKK